MFYFILRGDDDDNIPTYEKRRTNLHENITDFAQKHSIFREISSDEKNALNPYLEKNTFLYKEYQKIHQTELLSHHVYRVIGKPMFQEIRPRGRNGRHSYGGYYKLNNIEVLFPYRSYELLSFHEGNVVDIVLTAKYAIAVSINGTPITHLAINFTENTGDIDKIRGSYDASKKSEFLDNIEDVYTVRKETKQELSFFAIGLLKYVGSLCFIVVLFLLLYNINDSQALDNVFFYILLLLIPAVGFSLPKRFLTQVDYYDVYGLKKAKISHVDKDKITVDYFEKTFEFSYPHYWFDFMPEKGQLVDIEVNMVSKQLVKCGQLSIHHEVSSYGAPKLARFNIILLIICSIFLLWGLLVSNNVSNFYYTKSKLANQSVKTIYVDNYVELKNAEINIGDWLTLNIQSYCDLSQRGLCQTLIVNPEPLSDVIANDSKVEHWLFFKYDNLMNSNKPNKLVLHDIVAAVGRICDLSEEDEQKLQQCDDSKNYLVSTYPQLAHKLNWQKVITASLIRGGRLTNEQFDEFRHVSFDLINNYNEQNKLYTIDKISSHQQNQPIKIKAVDDNFNYSNFSGSISKVKIKQILEPIMLGKDVLVTSLIKNAAGENEEIGISTQAINQKIEQTVLSSAIVSTFFIIICIVFFILQVIFIFYANYKNKKRIKKITEYLIKSNAH